MRSKFDYGSWYLGCNVAMLCTRFGIGQNGQSHFKKALAICDIVSDRAPLSATSIKCSYMCRKGKWVEFLVSEHVCANR